MNKPTRISIFFLLIFSFNANGILSFSDAKELDEIPNNLQVNQNQDGIFKILNFNIEWGGLNDGWKTIIQNENPDIMTLVETGLWNPDDGTFDNIISEINSWFPNETPYQGVTYAASAGNDGEAILSRFPILSSNIIKTATLDDGSIWTISHKQVDVELDVYGTSIHVITNHLTCCGGGVSARNSEQEAMMNYVDSLGNVPVIYSGDFNSDSPEDIGNLAPLGSDLGGEALEIMLNSSHPSASKIHEFTDVYRNLNPHKPGYTQNHFWDVDVVRFTQRMSRTDYIFVNQHLKDTMMTSEVITSYEEAYTTSDHLPLVATFDLEYDTRDLKPPKSPAGMEITVDPINNHSTISWILNEELDIFKYQVYRNDCLLIEIPKDQNSFLDDYQYEGNSIYYYELKAVDTRGNISPTNEKKYINTSNSVITTPETPVLTAQGGNGGITVTWSTPSNGGAPILFYAVFTSNDLEYTCSSLSCFATSTSSNSYFRSVRAGIPFNYYVRAFNFFGGGDFSNIDSAVSSLSDLQLTAQNEEHPIVINQYQHNQVDCPATINFIALPTLTTTNSTSASSSKTSDSPIQFLQISTLSLIMALVLLRKRK